ncbi:putative transcription accessory protein [Streptomyces sp. Tu6071]|nr:putative transcription accessory protein [Streptomyces sp. Tu6071]
MFGQESTSTALAHAQAPLVPRPDGATRCLPADVRGPGKPVTRTAEDRFFDGPGLAAPGLVTATRRDKGGAPARVVPRGGLSPGVGRVCRAPRRYGLGP